MDALLYAAVHGSCSAGKLPDAWKHIHDMHLQCLTMHNPLLQSLL